MQPDVPAGAAPATISWLNGGGEMGQLVRAMDWSKTPLGPIASWPQSLRTTVSLCLASNFPISIAWGPHRIQIYNDGYWPICGGKHPRSMGQDFKECWFSAWPVIGEAFERVAAGETIFIENRRMFLDRHGYLEETFFTFSFSPILDETGGVGGVLNPVTELTQQTLAERRLKVLRDLTDHTADAQSVTHACVLIVQTLTEHALDLPFVLLYLLDADGKQVRLAGSAGLVPGTAASPAVVDVLAPQQPAWPLAEAARSGQTARVEDVLQRFGPLSCGPYPEPPQTALVLPISLVGLAQPFGLLVAGVSARRALDDAYGTFYDMLKDVVTNTLTNARAYEEERKRAEALAELDRAKTAFFSNVSHEFRTPLTLMLGPVEDLLAKPEGQVVPEHRELLTVVHRNGLRLQKLVNTLLDFSRIEAGRIQAVYEPTDLAVYTTELASVFRSAIEKAGLRLVVECPSLPETVYVDREMWEKIVLNLLSNAFKFTFAGDISVALRWCGEWVALSVCDTGVGIPTDELPHIFERFHRVRGMRSRTYEGTGIGLALVHELVKLHGGAITVRSAEGRGTTFTIAVPTGTGHLPKEHIRATRTLASTAIGATPFVGEALRWLTDEALDPGASSPAEYMQSGETVPLSNRIEAGSASACGLRARVLLADDNTDMRDYLHRLLSQRYDVITVADGAAALAAACQHKPDLVLTDVMMPRLDGFGLLQQLRADPQTSALPIILLSARAGEESRVEGLQHGADDYLIKPFSARELLARVSTHLELARIRKSTEEALRRGREELEVRVQERTAELATANATLQAEIVERQNAEDARTQLLRQLVTAQEEERRRISHELHDRMGQHLTAFMLLLKSLQDAAPGELSAHDSLRQLQSIANELRREVHHLALELRPTALDDLGLHTTLLNYVEEWSERYQIEVDFHSTGLDMERLPAPLETTLYRMVQEALTNVLKHAQAGRISLILERRSDHVLAIVEDNGCGFDAEEVRNAPHPERHLGLLGMRERAALVGGTCTIESAPGAGTTVFVRLPLPPHAQGGGHV